jgi:hypothetical protein
MQFQWSVSTMQITGSSIADKPFGAVLMGGDGTVAGEGPQSAEAFGAPGLVFRPRPPSDETGSDGQQYRVGTEALGARMGDELIPFTWRDLRFNKVYPSPKAGTVALVGYGGAFLSFDDVDVSTDPDVKKLETLATLYVPYADNSKCHSIVLDPKQDVLSITHGDGAGILLGNTGITMRSPGGASSIAITDTGIQLAALNIVLCGVTVVGGSPASIGSAVPLLAGPASPPCAALLLAPT